MQYLGLYVQNKIKTPCAIISCRYTSNLGFNFEIYPFKRKMLRSKHTSSFLSIVSPRFRQNYILFGEIERIFVITSRKVSAVKLKGDFDVTARFVFMYISTVCTRLFSKKGSTLYVVLCNTKPCYECIRWIITSLASHTLLEGRHTTKL